MDLGFRRMSVETFELPDLPISMVSELIIWDSIADQYKFEWSGLQLV